MDKAKILKRLKNGKHIHTFYKNNQGKVFTIHLDMKNDLFVLHSFYFDGNNVFKEDNYKEESLTTYSDFDELIRTAQTRFPGFEIQL
jgi:hypothetical protein